MRMKKTPRDFRKDNLKLLQSKKEIEVKSDTFRLVFKRLCAVLVLVVLITITFLLGFNSKEYTGGKVENAKDKIIEEPTVMTNITVLQDIEVVPSTVRISGEKVDLMGVHFIWQNSPSSFPSPKGVVFLAHTCKHLPIDWFTTNDFCTECNGLPMEVSVAHYLNQKGYVLLALRPFQNSNKSQCWHPNDKVNVTSAVNYVYDRLDTTITKLPLFAIGIANGGIFLGNGMESLQVTHKIKFSAVAFLNCGIWHSNYKLNKYAPVLFVDTTRNSELCEYNNATMYKMLDKGLSAAQLASEPLQLYPEFFHDATGLKILGQAKSIFTPSVRPFSQLSKEDSVKLFNGFKAAGFLWPATNILLKDPNIERFIVEYKEIAQKVLPSIVPLKDSMDWGVSPILQLLKVAWGSKHEISNEYVSQIVDWFELLSKVTDNPTIH